MNAKGALKTAFGQSGTHLGRGKLKISVPSGGSGKVKGIHLSFQQFVFLSTPGFHFFKAFVLFCFLSLKVDQLVNTDLF